MLGKRLINSNSAAAGGSCTTDTLQILGDNSCVAYYKMSDATDESGNFDGTPSSVNFNVAGKFGNAGSFNGSSSVITTSLDIDTLTNYTISMWVNPSSLAKFLAGTINSAANNGIYFFLDSGGTVRFVERTTTSNTLQSTDTISINTWNHLVFVRDGSTNYIYINNGTPVSTSNSNITNSVGFTLARGGDYTPANTAYYNGSIDQVRIFNKALSSTEVTTLYNEVQCVPTIVPTDYFEPIAYVGSGSQKSISGANFSPDLVWIKNRDQTHWHIITDRVRGAGKTLFSNAANAEVTNPGYGYLSSFDSNGFTVTPGSEMFNVGSNNVKYIAWCFKAGGTAVSNTDGTITSQVSANVDAGFSIVKWTGANTTSTSVGHGLDAAPEMVILRHTNLAGDWRVYHDSIPDDSFLYLNQTSALVDININKIYTATTISQQWTGGSYDWIAYCFHSVDGYSKFGSYKGNGNVTGPTIITGFRPAYVMIKRTDDVGNWWIVDNKRSPSNPRNNRLLANTTNDEVVYTPGNINFLANGFQPAGTYSSTNASGGTYIFMAFAEEVFVPDNFFNDDSTVGTYKLNGDAGDDSGNGNNGTASNVTYTTGKFDLAGVFNGSSSAIALPDNSFEFNNFSLSAWVNQATTGGNQTVFNTFQATSGATGYFFYLNTGRLALYIYGSTAIQVLVDVGDAITANSWFHVAVTCDSTNNVTKLYINGVEKKTGTAPAITWPGGNLTDPSIGANRWGNTNQNYWFNGKIDNTRIFNRALSSAEILQLKNE